jgi:hypothetical protein
VVGRWVEQLDGHGDLVEQLGGHGDLVEQLGAGRGVPSRGPVLNCLFKVSVI